MHRASQSNQPTADISGASTRRSGYGQIQRKIQVTHERLSQWRTNSSPSTKTSTKSSEEPSEIVRGSPTTISNLSSTLPSSHRTHISDSRSPRTAKSYSQISPRASGHSTSISSSPKRVETYSQSRYSQSTSSPSRSLSASKSQTTAHHAPQNLSSTISFVNRPKTVDVSSPLSKTSIKSPSQGISKIPQRGNVTRLSTAPTSIRSPSKIPTLHIAHKFHQNNSKKPEAISKEKIKEEHISNVKSEENKDESSLPHQQQSTQQHSLREQNSGSKEVLDLQSESSSIPQRSIQMKESQLISEEKKNTQNPDMDVKSSDKTKKPKKKKKKSSAAPETEQPSSVHSVMSALSVDPSLLLPLQPPSSNVSFVSSSSSSSVESSTSASASSSSSSSENASFISLTQRLSQLVLALHAKEASLASSLTSLSEMLGELQAEREKKAEEQEAKELEGSGDQHGQIRSKREERDQLIKKKEELISQKQHLLEQIEIKKRNNEEKRKAIAEEEARINQLRNDLDKVTSALTQLQHRFDSFFNSEGEDRDSDFKKSSLLSFRTSDEQNSKSITHDLPIQPMKTEIELQEEKKNEKEKDDNLNESEQANEDDLEAELIAESQSEQMPQNEPEVEQVSEEAYPKEDSESKEQPQPSIDEEKQIMPAQSSFAERKLEESPLKENYTDDEFDEGYEEEYEEYDEDEQKEEEEKEGNESVDLQFAPTEKEIEQEALQQEQPQPFQQIIDQPIQNQNNRIENTPSALPKVTLPISQPDEHSSLSSMGFDNSISTTHSPGEESIDKRIKEAEELFQRGQDINEGYDDDEYESEWEEEDEDEEQMEAISQGNNSFHTKRDIIDFISDIDEDADNELFGIKTT
ncbi:uncharacterized protein MONOS_9469 [Monocercomonoides exilis]|uniref:uncharacterized protein n=1 Tax=Monocercomonoides exilis TaxID=2049356 RepID=UPI00355A7C46|nr:hypothetical protein MONOS_9469 [Monocercomonoides exilis]|eukprot:MONOS_9469.1-p1 / transcript=MONOS_9469.1 / gene=MONOS_9469 / organism=Monocercomonoides_exilis_PA203 / gene_product=unspecified product / transcript_product=unspecified product / location=Mono_scaffold00392:38118-40820(+) / protein_length=863 / sequence_SO=supercontig / SO=protein_coding / is_pseudo=false